MPETDRDRADKVEVETTNVTLSQKARVGGQWHDAGDSVEVSPREAYWLQKQGRAEGEPEEGPLAEKGRPGEEGEAKAASSEGAAAQSGETPAQEEAGPTRRRGKRGSGEEQ